MDEKAAERLTKKIGSKIFGKVGAQAPNVWEASWWERQVIKWISEEPEIKSRVLRFIDVFPSLKTYRQIARHIREYLPEKPDRLPPELRLGRSMVESALVTPGAVAMATSLAIKKTAAWFIAGATMEETATALEKLRAKGMSYTLDILGEATLSDKEAEKYLDKYLAAIDFLSSLKTAGEVNVSVKLSSLTPRFNPGAPEKAVQEASEGLRRIMRRARKRNAKVNVDMEHYYLRDLTLEVFKNVLGEKEFDGWSGAGIVAQAYLKDSEESLEAFVEWVVANNKEITVRLVKGAYWEQEIVTADQRRWPVPVRRSKPETDAAFERMTAKLLSSPKNVHTAIASHNIRSIARALATASELDTPDDRYEVQMLFGMADEIKSALVEMNVPLRVYTPVGEPLPGMAYLVRRILENSSNESFLRKSFIEEGSEKELLLNPAEAVKTGGQLPRRNEDTQVFRYTKGDAPVFVNEPDPPFHRKSERDQIDSAIEKVMESAGRFYPLVVGGKKIETQHSLKSMNPADTSQVVGVVAQADAALADKAMESSKRAFDRWRNFTAERRMELLIKAAEIIRKRKHLLAAWQMFEVGKTRFEAVADVDEAIDHINFYAICGLSLFKSRTTRKMLGEINYTKAIPRGPGVVISPWNFPLAILAGLTSSALAAGNTVTIKPSSQSSVTAALFVDILHQAGIPKGAVNFLPGPGASLGPALINHKWTSFVSFTGSFDVGGSIVESAGSQDVSRNGFVKVVAEMGGKNAIIIDESADLDEAVSGVVSSAFGYGGQKCSACSRVIVVNTVYQEFIDRVVDATESLIVGSPLDPASDFGPLIDRAALKKAQMYINIGTKEATPLLAPKQSLENGHYVMPVIFGDTPPASRVATEEIFGPLLSIIRACDIDDALEIANQASYALTGGIYSRTPSTVEKAVRKMEAGNIYINRKITGAVVERQPFGGFKRSGLGSAKAGSCDLARELSIPQTITENIVRHGFSPDIES